MAPRFDYGRQSHLTKVDGEPRGVQHRRSRPRPLRHRRRSTTTTATSGRGDGRRRRPRVLRARVGGRRHARRRSGTATSCGSSTTPGTFWHDWVEQRHLSGSVAGDGLPLGHHAQAPDLRTGRFDRGRVDRRAARNRSAASGTGTTATRGSATDRSRSGPCSRWASGTRRSRSRCGCGIGPSSKREDGSPPLDIMYRVDGSSISSRRRSITSGRLSGLTAGADRQRCRPAAAARHLRRVPRLAVPARPGRTHDRRCRVDRPSPRSSTGCATTGINPTKACGRHEADGSRSCTAGSCAGSRSTAPSGSPRNRSYPASLERWTSERDRIYRAIHDKGWNDELKAFVQYEGSDVLDASFLLMPLMGFISPIGPEVGLHVAGDGPHARVGQPRVPLRPQGIAGRTERIGRHLLDLHVLVRLGARSHAVGSETPA